MVLSAQKMICPPFQALSDVEQQQLEDGFHKMVVPGTVLLPVSHLMHMLRIMNIAAVDDDIKEVVAKFGISTTAGGENNNSNNNASSNSAEQQQQQVFFDFASIVKLYDYLGEKQNGQVQEYMQFFNLLDTDALGYVSLTDVRHVLCNLGDSLTDVEFNHMLYVHNLLHRASVTLYEFVRLLMNIPPNVVEGVGNDLDSKAKAAQQPSQEQQQAAPSSGNNQDP